MNRKCEMDGCKKDGVYALVTEDKKEYWFCTKKHIEAFLTNREDGNDEY